MTAKPLIVTYETDLSRSGVRRLQQSLDKWGWSYFIISDDNQWLGFGRKFKKVVEYCSGLKSTGYTHVISIDARDSLAVGPPGEFVAPEAPLLLSAEVNCWPKSELQALYPDNPSPWKYVHSPFTADLNRLDLLRADDLADGDDDQLHLTRLFLAGSPEIALDYECRIVQSIYACQPFHSKFEISHGRVKNTITGSVPLFLHGNGDTDMAFFFDL